MQQPGIQPPPNAYYPGVGYPGAYMVVPVPPMMPGQPVPGAYPHYGQTPNQVSPLRFFTSIFFLGESTLRVYKVTASGVDYDIKNVNGKDEMVPADPDPFRMYWVRELDQTFTQRDRRTIDSGDIGDCRWYVKDGKFYAVRLPTG